MLKNKWRGMRAMWSAVFELPRFINDYVATHLSYLRKYGEYRITVETLNRPFVLPHSTVLALFVKRTHNMSSILNFWNRFIRSNGRHSCANLAVQYPKNVLYYNFEPEYPALRFQQYVEGSAGCYVYRFAGSFYIPLYTYRTMTSRSDA